MAAETAVETHRAKSDERVSLLVFRAGSAQAKAVPLSLVTRLEEIDAHKIELSNGRHMVQYRGQLMPLVRMSEQIRVKDEGSQPLLVFSDGGRSMALIVDEIIDIVEDRLDIEVTSDHPGVLGSAVIRGQATEVIDVGHFLPLAFEDWFRTKAQTRKERTRKLLLVDDSPFFRNMLSPVLQAAGYEVVAAASGREAIELLKTGGRFDLIVTDVEMPGMSGFDLAEAVRAEPATRDIPVIALSSMVSAESVERGRQVGLHDYIAKFDRQGLIAALKEHSAETQAA
jgi:two-component system chemotaxis sensor kinase CheA